MKKIITAFLAIYSLVINAQSQQPCGADELRINTLKQHPAVAKAVIKRDADLEHFTQTYVQNYYSKPQAQRTSTTTATYIIPVVFHVIHNYGAENISDAQLKDGLDIVNKTFRKQHPSNSTILPAFQAIHADCDIEFRLATKDPNGNCHSGINRIASTLTSTGDHRIKSLIHWPPDKYLNVYVVSNAAGLAGHAVWPGDADTIPLWDGIVLSHNYVGTIGTSNLTQSVAFAHECGHYLNLHHIWGGNNVPGFYYYPCADPAKDCNIDDLVADTPPTIGWQSCNLNGASCGNTVDNVQNAMDYSYCNIMFTQGQAARMQACLNSTVAARSNLWQTANLIATGVYTPAPVCAADFVSNKNIACAGSQITFTNTSYHGTFTSVEWNFPGGVPATSAISNPTVTYSSPGSYNVSLKVKNGNDSAMIAKQNTIIIQAGTATGTGYPFFEGFESTASLYGSDWYCNNLDSSNTWELTSLAAYSGSKCVMVNNIQSGLDGKDELYSKPLNLTGATGLNISFKYAYARKDTASHDQLQVYCYSNCNSTQFQRFNLSGATLETVPPVSSPFYPTSVTDWKTGNATLFSTVYTSGFRFKFVFTGHGGNNVFIDDINLNISTGLEDITGNVQLSGVFPNPAADAVTIRFTSNVTKTMYAEVYNALGEKMMRTDKYVFYEGENELPLNVSALPAGIYFVHLTDGLRSVTSPLVISK